LSVFPLFVDLKGKLCVVVGGGKVAARKVETLLRFEPDLCIIAPEVDSYIETLEKQGLIKIKRKDYCREDLEGAFLVIAATSSDEVNKCVFENAKERNLSVNVVDDPDKCSFIFPSVVKRGDLVIGISTSGTYPALTKKIRKLTEELFNEDYSEILDMLADFRVRVRNSNLNRQEREAILKKVVEEFYEEGVITKEALSKLLDKYNLLIGGCANQW
jgi:precorrin-2 dehydrogenase/sirohydrochlorin ferrochelatase